MSRAVPWWVRGVVASDRALAEALALRAAVRDAALLHLLDADTRAAVTAWRYAGQTTYLPGGAAYTRGLFDWEREALEHLQLAPGARVLVGGAGGGRELAALAALGFTAVGFDPSPGLVAGAAGRLPAGASLVQGDYAALCEAVEGRGGALAGTVAAGPWDAVVCGWGSLSHLPDAASRRRLFAALAALTPRVLVSTVLPPRHRGRAGKVFGAVGAALDALGARGRPEADAAYVEGVGFVARVELAALDALAAQTGWTRVWGAQGHNCHAVYRRCDVGAAGDGVQSAP